MSNPQATEELANALYPDTSSQWFAALSHAGTIPFPAHIDRVRVGDEGSNTLYLTRESGSAAPVCAESSSCGVIFNGALYTRNDLIGELRLPADTNDAQVILAGYARWGEDFFTRLRGIFALVIWDSSREVLFCLRDPIGTCPMFYAETRNGLLVSTSIDLLLRQPHVSPALNRAALADYFLDRFPKLDETFFEAVKRVPPGQVLRVTREGRRSYRYWDPAPDGKVTWLTPDEVERFDELMEQAVRRCLSFGSAGIFLSGGLDSVTVAALAAESATSDGMTKPWALSLVFPDPKISEEIVQRAVAAHLGLSQVVKPFSEAVGRNGLLAEAVAMNSSLSAPIINTWLPVYDSLAREGTQRGCRTILTGIGGDEWLTVTPMLAADLWRNFDLTGVFRLWQILRRSYRRPASALLRGMVWTFGAKPLIVPPVHRVIKRIAPWALRLRRRVFAPPPSWVAPDSALRRELEKRWEERSTEEAPTSGSFYIDELKDSLDHPLVSWEIEEHFNFGEKAGLRMLHPFLDADLVDLLFRTPPFQLFHNGRTKGLVRLSLARRFPNLGFEQQRKIEATDFYFSLIYQDAQKIWSQLGGLSTLASLGVVDGRAAKEEFERLLKRRRLGDAQRVWSMLNLESWARAHTS
jgi:asparagine synthase (glutamine-hydrolysing)